MELFEKRPARQALRGSDAAITSTDSTNSISAANLRNNTDIRKRFWKINAVHPINKGNSKKIGESPQDATKQIEADCGTN